MMILTRRAALVASSAMGLVSYPPPPVTLEYQELTLDTCADLICNLTPVSFRQSVRKTQHFLYRGSEDDVLASPATPKVASPEPDLLIEGTYDDPLALDYFTCLESKLGASPVRPSTGHVATSDPGEAAKWGEPVSVWPLGTNWAYVWPRETQLFFPTKSIRDCQQSNFFLNLHLEDALRLKREVLFASWFEDADEHLLSSEPYVSFESAFLTIPMRYDEEIKRELWKRHYGLN
jgi:hypothetical protein